MSIKQLVAFLDALSQDLELKDSVTNTFGNLDLLASISKEANFDINRGDWLRLQSMRLGSRLSAYRSENWQGLIAPLTDIELDELALELIDLESVEYFESSIQQELLKQVHLIFNENEDAILGNKEELILYVANRSLMIDIVSKKRDKSGSIDYEYDSRGVYGDTTLPGTARALEGYLKMGGSISCISEFVTQWSLS